LSAANDQDFGIGCIYLLGSLRLPANSAVHVSISRTKLGELFELFSNTVHGIYPPAISGKDGFNHSRSHDKLGLERNHNLELSEVGIRSFDAWSWFQEFEIAGFSSREQVLSGLENCWLKVECTLIPRERELIAPYAWGEILAVSARVNVYWHMTLPCSRKRPANASAFAVCKAAERLWTSLSASYCASQSFGILTPRTSAVGRRGG
jgi:hypothetical protein